MSPHPYTEDQLIEQPAIALLAELGWTTVTALDEVLGLEGTFGRETKSDVVLTAHLRAALVRLNPDAPAEDRTREVFGDYVSIYDFQQSVEDGATVRLFYENRTPELRLQNPALNDDIYALVEAAELDEDQEKRLEQELGRQYHLITRDDRLDTIAKDIVRHFLGRGFQGKPMVVSIDKATALRMHDKVQTHWQAGRPPLLAITRCGIRIKTI
jgi:type I site-specific restriction-modification system R (restriction) subunit